MTGTFPSPMLRPCVADVFSATPAVKGFQTAAKLIFRVSIFHSPAGMPFPHGTKVIAAFLQEIFHE